MRSKYSAILVILILVSLAGPAPAQTYGLDAGLSATNAYFLGGHLNTDHFIYKFAVTVQLSDTKGEEVSEQKPNYGKTVEGRGDYFYSLDLGAGYVINRRFTVNGELSLARKKQYTNYIDNRFSDGGYHMITEDKLAVGIGICAGIHITGDFGVLIGYHSLREFFGGISIEF